MNLVSASQSGEMCLLGLWSPLTRFLKVRCPEFPQVLKGRYLPHQGTSGNVWNASGCHSWCEGLGGRFPLIDSEIWANTLQGPAWPHNKALLGPKCQQRPDQECVQRNVSLEGPGRGAGGAQMRQICPLVPCPAFPEATTPILCQVLRSVLVTVQLESPRHQ